jgi:hypothetical protein
MWQDSLRLCAVLTVASEEFAPYYLAGIRHDIRQTTAAVLFLRDHPAAQKYLARLEKKHDKGKALTILAQKLARAVYYMLKRQGAFDRDKFIVQEFAFFASVRADWLGGESERDDVWERARRWDGFGSLDVVQQNSTTPQHPRSVRTDVGRRHSRLERF